MKRFKVFPGTFMAVASLVLLLALAACSGGASSVTLETIEVDLQPDPATLALQDLNGNGTPDPGEPFSIRAIIYTPGTNTKIGDFVCEGVFIANVAMPGMDQAPVITNAPDGQFTSVRQSFNITGKGSLLVSGTEPGTGPGQNQRAVVGGTGQFAGATGIITQTLALGVSLTPAFSADPVVGVPVTFLSERVKFEIRRTAQ